MSDLNDFNMILGIPDPSEPSSEDNTDSNHHAHSESSPEQIHYGWRGQDA